MKLKKVVLFYPKTDKENSNIQLPLSVLSIASDLINSGYLVEIIDERMEPNYKRYLPKKIKDAGLFGISVMTGYQIKGGIEASGLVKKINKDVPVVWGGWHVSILPEETLQNPCIDIGVIGAGEAILQRIYDRFADGERFSSVDNILYKDKGKVVYNTAIHNNLKSVCPINKEALNLINIENYIHRTDLGTRSIFWVTSRGCPFNCGFCCSLKVYERAWKAVDADKVVADISWLTEEYGIDGINIVDTNFFVDKKRVLEISQKLIAKKIRIGWGASVRVDQINMFDADFLKTIKESGCTKLFIGAESGSKEVLELIDKNITVEDAYKMVKILSDAGIIAEIYVMAGFPINPEKDLEETLSLVKRIKQLYPDHQFVSFLYTPYPGTPLFELAKRKGLLVPSSLEGWIDWNILEVKTPWIASATYADRLHSFIKVFYPLAFPSGNLRRIFNDPLKGWLYRLLHKVEYLRVKNNFFFFPIEWSLFKFLNNLRLKYGLLEGFSGFR